MLVGAGGPRARLLRRPDPRPRALRLPVLRARGDPRRRLGRWRLAYVVLSRRDVREHVRRPDDALPGQPVDRGLAGHRRRSSARERGVVAVALVHTARVRLGARPAAGRRRASGSPTTIEAAAARTSRAPASRPRPSRRTPPTGGRRRGRDGRGSAPAPRRPPAGASAAAARRGAAARGCAAALPTWTDRPSFGEARRSSAGCATGSSTRPSGRTGRRPCAARAAAGSTGSTSGSSSSARGQPLGDAHVPPRRAVPDALRRGLPRPDRDRVPAGLALRRVARHLRVDPPAPRQVRDGRRARRCGATTDVSGTSELGVPVRAAAVEPRRDDACDRTAGRRPPPRRDRRRGPGLRPARRAPSSARSPCPGVGALAVDDDGHRLLVGDDDGRDRDARPARSTPRRLDAGLDARAARLAPVDHPVARLLVTDDGATILAASDDRS